MKAQLRSVVRSLRKNEFIWRYGFNLSPSVEYSIKGRNGLSSVETRVLNDLNRDGISRTSVDELFGNIDLFGELTAAAEQMLRERKEQIARLNENANDTSTIGSKTFNLELLGSELDFDPDDVFARFSITPALLSIANAYLRMYAQLRYYNVWYTFATSNPARESQLWHFDREDNYILKVFVYLRDVDQGTGPFTYAPGTHRKGRFWNRKPEAFNENNVLRTTDEQMDAVIPRENWVTATGKKGDIIFADTRGYHKGGEARVNNRFMYTCMFTSPASDSKRLLKYPHSSVVESLGGEQQLALRSRV